MTTSRKSPCKGCGALRSKVPSFQPSSCKKERLCEKIDRALIDRYAGESFESLQGRAQQLQVGFVKGSEFSLRQPVPCTPFAFRTHVLELHRIMFCGAAPEIAGRFRATHEEVEVDEGRHRFLGVPGDRIEGRLDELFSNQYRDLGSPANAEVFASRAAVFLLEFFDVHPFLDGNGRVARLLLLRAARDAGGWGFALLRTHGGAATRKYVYALRHARSHRGPEPLERLGAHGRPRSPFGPLRRWVESMLVAPADDLIEEEPG